MKASESKSRAGFTTCASPAKLCFPDRARRQRPDAVRGGEEQSAGRRLRSSEESDPGKSFDRSPVRVRAEARAPGGYELDVTDVQVHAARSGRTSLSDHAQRARRRFPDGSPPPVAAQPPAACGHPRPARSDQRRFAITSIRTASRWWIRRSSRRRRAKAPRRCSKWITSKTRKCI